MAQRSAGRHPSRLDGLDGAIALHGSEETDPTEVDTQDRDRQPGQLARTSQQRTITTKGDQQIHFCRIEWDDRSVHKFGKCGFAGHAPAVSPDHRHGLADYIPEIGIAGIGNYTDAQNRPQLAAGSRSSSRTRSAIPSAVRPKVAS